MFCFCFLFFNDFSLTSYLKIYQIQTDLRLMFRVGRAMAVDNPCQISFSIPRGSFPWQPIFVGFNHRRLVAQPGGLMLGFALHLVVSL